MKNKTSNFIIYLLILFISACSEDTLDDTGLGTISGVVVEEGNNEPIENVKISTSPASSTVFTDENGEFTLEDIPSGEYSVQAKKEGLLTQFEGANVMANSSINLVIELQQETAGNKQPTIPVAGTPGDNATSVSLPVQFSWSSADDENDDLTFNLEIRNNSNDEVLLIENIQDTVHTVDGLDHSTKYFWQVSASDGINPEVHSSLYSFSTLDIPQGRVLFTRQINGNNVIFLRNEDGEITQLTSSSHNSFRPRRNNSSNQIAFLRTIGAHTHLFTMNPDGSNQQQVTSAVPVRGYNMAQVDFSWANDGASLLYPSFEKLYQITLLGGGLQLIYETTNGDFITEVSVSENNNRIALITNNNQGYDANLFTINFEGELQDEILKNVTGALGGLDISVTDELLLYTHDVSGFENEAYRRLDSRIFLYDLSTGQTTDLSTKKLNGTNDLDPRFSPNEASIIFVNTSNDGISQKDIYTLRISEYDEDKNRELLVENAAMPDWE